MLSDFCCVSLVIVMWDYVVVKLPLLPLKPTPRSCLLPMPSLFPVFVYWRICRRSCFVTVESAPKASIIRSLSHRIKIKELRFQSAKCKSIVSLMRMVKVTCAVHEAFHWTLIHMIPAEITLLIANVILIYKLLNDYLRSICEIYFYFFGFTVVP